MHYKNSSIQDIIQTLAHIYNHVFLETQKQTKQESFIRTINYMSQAKQIDFYTNDNNYTEVQLMSLKFDTIGICAQVFNTINTVNLNPHNTLAFVICHSGSNKAMIDVAQELKKKDLRIIGIIRKLSS